MKGLAMWWKQAICNAAQERSQNSNTFLESSNEGFRSQGRTTSGNVFRTTYRIRKIETGLTTIMIYFKVYR